MDHSLYTECGEDFLPGYEGIAEDVIETVLKRFPAPRKVQISLYVVEDEEIQSANLSQRGMDKVTDVLSFPALPFPADAPGDYSAFPAEEAGNIDPETDELILGEIMICRSKVYSQAEEYGHKAEREFAFLCAHSMLHLLGFDHEDEEERERMEELQEEILKEAGYER
ncbi:MAG: rRNA maturation RNase YbeY [Lachnospiraceae bacterium]|nr:rRNA maturation RNase YbeY [Lachnospiraceae bacterium]